MQKKRDISLYAKLHMYSCFFFFFSPPSGKTANVRDIFGQCFHWTITRCYTVDDR